MKNWTWKEWTAFGLVMAVLIAEVVSIFVAPWAGVLGAATALCAFIAGRISGKYVTISNLKNDEKAV